MATIVLALKNLQDCILHEVGVCWPGPWPGMLPRPEASDDGEQLRVWFAGKPGEVIPLEPIAWAEISQD